jgi:RHS repeat-associated protein
MQYIQLLSIGEGAIKTSLDHLSVNEFSGALNYSVPLEITPARELTPALALSYHASVVKSCFGLGFNLAISQISRSTLRGIPLYDNEKDCFLFNGEELVSEGKDETLTTYRFRQESKFYAFEFRQEGENAYWIVRQPDGVNHIFGKTAKISVPQQAAKVFTWLLEETYDAKGNRILYQYEEDQEDANYYLKSIKYGNYVVDSGTEECAFQLIFDYKGIEADIYDRDKLLAPGFTKRLDNAVSYQVGFPLKISRLCHNILEFHLITELNGAQPFLVKRWALNYQSDSLSLLTTLSSVQQHGYKKLAKEYISKSLPPIKLSYARFDPPREFASSTIQTVEDAMKPDNLLSFKFVDLYREGLPGILYSDDYTSLFWRNKGNGKFDSPVSLGCFPIERTLNSRRYQLMEISGTDQLAFVVGEENYGGYYASLGKEGWENYQEFESYPSDFTNPIAEFIDLNNSGMTDLVLFNEVQKIYYPSLGKKGFAEPRPLDLSEADDFPVTRLTDEAEMISTENIFGDGLSHRIRVTQKTIECWPNLGHGKFGSKIMLRDVPDLGDDFCAKQLYFAQVAGTGAVDLIYLTEKTIKVYVNQQGGRFAKNPVEIQLPEDYTDFDQIRFVDLLGKGVACLVFSKLGITSKHYYLDFSPSQKPYFLRTIDNGFGLQTTLSYVSSVDCYVNDLNHQRTPRYKCSFPVSVIEKITKMDQATQMTLVDRYQFHDAYYDPVERQFSGFGFVEYWDSNERLEEYDSPICYSKRWYHCGAVMRSAGELSFTNFYQPEYSKIDAKAYLLPDSVPDIDGSNITNELTRQIAFSLQGQLLREEIYSQEKDKTILYLTHENNYRIRCLQCASKDQQEGAFIVQAQETLSHNYEANSEDPRIEHTFHLEWDKESNSLLKSCVIHYPRRGDPDPAKIATYREACTAVYQQQKETKILATFRAVKSKCSFPKNPLFFSFAGYPKEEKVFAIDAKTVAGNLPYVFAKVKDSYQQAIEAPTNFLEHHQYIYWHDQDESYPPSLVHHEKALVESKEVLMAIYRQRFADNLDNILKNEAGYFLEEDNWWHAGFIHHYDAQHYYQLNKKTSVTEDPTSPLWRQLEMQYDRYQLVRTSMKYYLYNTDTKQPVGFILTKATIIDYDACAPRQIMDANENTSEILFDPLGVVVARSHYGTVNGIAMGNDPLDNELLADLIKLKPTDLIKNPLIYLQNAGAIFAYDYCPGSALPTSHSVITREQFQHSLPPFDPQVHETAEKVQVMISYVDGLGYDIQVKSKKSAAPEKWLVSAFALYNNKGLVVKEYLPYYSNTFTYETQPPSDQPLPKITSYDALDRLVGTVMPDQSKTKTIFAAWYKQYFDENDNSEEAPDYDTPKIEIFDTLAQPYQHIEVLKYAKDDEPKLLRTEYAFNVLGQTLTIKDPRLKQPNITYGYNKIGGLLVEDSVDHGKHIKFYDCYNNVLKVLDSKDVLLEYQLDNWDRLLSLKVSDAIIERAIYGEFDPQAKANNLYGQKRAHYDQVGATIYDSYDILGHPLVVSRQLLALPSDIDKLKNPTSWADIGAVKLKELYKRKGSYNALGTLITQQLPDGTILDAKFNLLEQLEVLSLLPFQGEKKNILERIEYSALGHEEEIIYGNGVSSTYTYEAKTQRLSTHLTSLNAQPPLQNLAYKYDPVGNIKVIDDQSYRAFFGAANSSLPPLDYAYDSLYRLKKAGVRELKKASRANPFTFFKNKEAKDELSSYEQIYQYDDGDNLVEVAEGTQEKKKYVIVEDSNHLQSEQKNDESAPETPFTYDQCGNQEKLDENVSLEWNWQDQLVHVIKRDEKETHDEYFYYDAAGWRARTLTIITNREDNSRKIFAEINFKDYEVRHELDANTLEVKPETETIKIRIHDGLRFVASYHAQSGQCTYHLNNHLLSICVEVDERGEILTYEEYLPFGGTSFIIGKDPKWIESKIYRYSSKEYDEKTGLYYYGVRHYSPELSRWTSPDPERLIDGLNVYAFVGNNSINFIDSIGEVRKKATSKEFGEKRTKLTNIFKNARIAINKQLKGRLDQATLRSHFDDLQSHVNQATTRQQLTEAHGEFTAARTMLQREPKYTMLSGFSPGVGIDQIWEKGREKGMPGQPILAIVEAKGPGATLGWGRANINAKQMSFEWVKYYLKNEKSNAGKYSINPILDKVNFSKYHESF